MNWAMVFGGVGGAVGGNAFNFLMIFVVLLFLSIAWFPADKKVCEDPVAAEQRGQPVKAGMSAHTNTLASEHRATEWCSVTKAERFIIKDGSVAPPTIVKFVSATVYAIPGAIITDDDELSNGGWWKRWWYSYEKFTDRYLDWRLGLTDKKVQAQDPTPAQIGVIEQNVNSAIDVQEFGTSKQKKFGETLGYKCAKQKDFAATFFKERLQYLDTLEQANDRVFNKVSKMADEGKLTWSEGHEITTVADEIMALVYQMPLTATSEEVSENIYNRCLGR